MNEKPNLNYIQQLSGGDKDFENELLQVLKKELPAEIETYSNALKEANFKMAAEVVHKIKHKISILGLDNSYQIAIDYEEELKKNSINLQNKFEIILTSMINFINEV